MGTSERFKTAYDYLENKGFIHKKAQLAKMMGYSRSVVSNAYNGNDDFASIGFLQKFCMVFPNIFNYEWLVKGDGEMLRADYLRQESAKDKEPTNISHEDFSALLRQNSELIEMLRKEIAALRQELQQMKFEHNYRKNTG